MKLRLRSYQQKAIDQTLDWMDKNQGNLVVSLATGAGKSVIIGEFCRYALQTYQGTKILMLVHTKELIAQNHERLKTIWPEAPVGIFSAGLKQKNMDQITYAGIQSIHKHPEKVGHVDLVLVDECHLISHKNEGTYRKLINALKEINEKLRVVGFTGTPYRMGHGYIHEGSALFDGMIEPVGIKDLLDLGYLTPLRSKFTEHQLETEGVKKRGGEYVEKDLQLAVNTTKNNARAVVEMCRIGENRKSWLIFCTGVEHAENIAEILNFENIPTKVITGNTPHDERDLMIQEFKEGKIRALSSVNVVSIGFDAPNVDMLVMLRPTMSPSMYVQQAGRGMRLAEGKKDCLVLDFAGNVSEHGPIVNVKPPKKKGEGKGEAPVKVCEKCQEIVHLSVMVCPACGEAFPPPPPKATRLHQDDIMGKDRLHELSVQKWRWQKYTSQRTGKTMLKVVYYGALSDVPVKQYFTIWHEGYAGNKARVQLFDLFNKAGLEAADLAQDPSDIAKIANKGKPPALVKYEKNGRFQNVISLIY